MTDGGATADPGQELREALRQLPTEEILTLAYRFRSEPARLRFYLDVLRQLGGRKAALAASLICFDLASQGHHTSQREFEALAATLRDFDARDRAVAELIAGSVYLTELWPVCEKALFGMDPRTSAAEALAVEDVEVVEIQLFDEEEWGDFDDLIVESFDLDAMAGRFRLANDHFFDTQPDRQYPPGSRGFFARTQNDIERVENFLRELDSVREFVPAARGLLALGELFLATHLRTRSFWGKPNKRRIELVESGLRHFHEAGESLFEAAAHLSGRDAEEQAWEKVLQILLDFFRWRATEQPGSSEDAVKPYAQAARHLPHLRFEDRRSGRR